MMEGEDLKKGKVSHFVPAMRNDTINGIPKYLPVQDCEVTSVGSVKETAVAREKRSEFGDGILRAGEKLLDGSPGGFFVEMLKTLAKPVYNRVIGSDNDQVMSRFTTRMLPETEFRGHPEEYQIASHARNGDGAAVWTTMSENTVK